MRFLGGLIVPCIDCACGHALERQKAIRSACLSQDQCALRGSHVGNERSFMHFENSRAPRSTEHALGSSAFMLKLHHAPHTRGIRVIWLCEEMNLPYELAPVPFPPDDAHRARYSVGSVPLLEDGDVQMGESTAMLLYLAQKYGPTPLLPAVSDSAFAQTLQFLVYGETTISMWINTMNVARFFAPPEHKDNWSVGEAEVRVTKAIDYLSAALGDRDHIAGDRFTIADISCAFPLGVWRRLYRKTLPENLGAYLKRMESRDAFRRAYDRQKDLAPVNFG